MMVGTTLIHVGCQASTQPHHAEAEKHPLWYRELHGFADHRPETEEYGVSCDSVRAMGSPNW